MKRFGGLYPSICAFNNLLVAFQKARKGKRSHPNVTLFEYYIEYEILALKEELEAETYHPGPYRTFMIYDPKERMISAAPFRDRVVHHALCNVIEPLLDKTLIYDTYANRKGKGTHAAIRRCQHFVRRYPFVLKADIRKYFPSIDHQILKKSLAKKIKCRSTLQLIDKIIDNSNPQEPVEDYFPGDDLFGINRRRGLPMGNLTSQFFANLYLSPLDHFIKDELGGKGYVRYVDDFVLFGSSKTHLRELLGQLNDFLADNLRLRLHPKKSVIFPTDVGVPFLGQRIFPSHRLIRKENLKRARKRTEKRLKAFHNYTLSPDKLEEQFNSYLGHIRQADTWHLEQKLFRQLRFSDRIPLFVTLQGSWKVLADRSPFGKPAFEQPITLQQHKIKRP